MLNRPPPGSPPGLGPNYRYDVAGTSFSAPVVSGMLAEMLAAHGAVAIEHARLLRDLRETAAPPRWWLIAAALLSVPVCAALLRLYRRSVIAGMAERKGDVFALFG